MTVYGIVYIRGDDQVGVSGMKKSVGRASFSGKLKQPANKSAGLPVKLPDPEMRYRE